MSTKELIDSAVEHLRASASVKTVYGEPIVVDGKTVVPVAKVAFGFGGTGTKQAEPPAHGEPPVAGEAGQGTAGGVSAKPVGVVEISKEETKFVPFGQTRKLTIAAGLGAGLGFVLGALLARGRHN